MCRLALSTFGVAHMTQSTVCPSQDELDALASGNISPGAKARLQRHIDACSNCQRTNAFSVSGTTPKLKRRIRPNAVLPPQACPTHDRHDFPFLLPPQSSDELGRLNGYRVLRLLGQGGMGYVFLAEDLALARPVALKVMKPASVHDPESAQRFLREARALAALKHDHLVTIYQAGHERDVAYFAMELLEGETLESWIRKKPPTDPAEILRIARQIASGLVFLHTKNLIHRDLKPVNIWLEGPERRVKILDLGLVRSLSDDASLTADGIVMGTPEFMSPEQARGEPLDARSDLFSLGSSLYYLCTGKKPYQGASSLAVIIALSRDTPEPIRNVNARIPPLLGDLVMQLLSPHPDDRPSSAAKVLLQLDGIAADMESTQAIAAPTKGNRKRKKRKSDTQVLPANAGSGAIDIRRPSKRRGTLWPILAGCMLVFALTVGAIYMGSRWFPSAEPRDDKVNVAVYLTHLQDAERVHWPFHMGEPKKGKEKKGGPPNGNDPVLYRSKHLPKAIFMHPPPPHAGAFAALAYQLDGKYATFESEVSLRDGPAESESPVVFHVIGDGKTLWKSNPVMTQDHTQKCIISVKGVKHLKIAVSCDGQPFGAHAIWIDPRLTK